MTSITHNFPTWGTPPAAVDPRKYVKIAASLYKEGLANDDVSKMAEAAIEYREVLRLLGINADTGELIGGGDAA